MSTFESAFALLVGHEGGLSLDQADPGNWTGGRPGQGTCRGTKYGISAAAYPDIDIANLTVDQAADIYRRDFWNRIMGNSLPPPLALLVFDAAVNNGIARATEWLQQAAGAEPDGVIGPATAKAVQRAAQTQGGAALCAEFLARRLSFMASLPTWRTFGLGWARRLCSLPYQSLTMTEGDQTHG